MKKKTIGSITKSRGGWTRKPITQIVPNKKKVETRSKLKEKVRQGYFDD